MVFSGASVKTVPRHCADPYSGVISRLFLPIQDENLRYARLGFQEGVIATSNVLEAQTAWLSAQSEKIDAQIDVKLTEIYLQKSLGTLK